MKSKLLISCYLTIVLTWFDSIIISGMDTIYAQRCIQIDGGNKVEMLIIDPLGRKSGYDLISDREYDEIPGANVGATGIGTITEKGPEEDPGMPSISALINNPLDGEYQIILYGFGLSDGYVNIMAEHASGPITNVVASGIVDSALSVTFRFKYDYNSRENTVLEKVVFDTTLRQDLELCYKIGWINNKGIYNSLLKKVENAESAHQRGQNKAARNILNAFINEVKAQQGKKIDDYAAEKILIYDAEALIKQWR